MNPLAIYQSFIQTWVNTVEHAQSNMLAFHQAVASIQGYRARALGQWWQQAPNHITAILTSPTPADALAQLTLWQGYTTIQATTLGTDTHAARAHLFKVWSRTFATTTTSSTATAQQTSFKATAAALTPAATTTPASAPKAATTSNPSSSNNKQHTKPTQPETATATSTRQTTSQPASATTQTATQQPPQTQQQTSQQAQTSSTSTPPQTAKVVKLADVQKTEPQKAEAQQPQQATQAEPIAVNGNTTPTHSPTATTFARNTGHALNSSAAPRRTASIPNRTSRSRPR